MKTSVLLLAYLLHVSYARQVNVTHKVVFTVTSAGNNIGKIVIGLFGGIVPKTAKNFATFATPEGHNGKSYKGSIFHRIIPDFMIQGGDIISRDGTGSISIYGRQFADENFELKHSEPGILSMANSGPNTNGCQFFITIKATPWLNGKHVVFGKVLSGLEHVVSISQRPRNRGDKPRDDIVISETSVTPMDISVNLKQ